VTACHVNLTGIAKTIRNSLCGFLIVKNQKDCEIGFKKNVYGSLKKILHVFLKSEEKSIK